MSWIDRGKGIPDRIRQEELQYRQIQEEWRKKAEAKAKGMERAFRELYPRVEKVCKQFTDNVKGKLKRSRTSYHGNFCVMPLSRRRDHREVYVDVFGSDVTISAICFTEPFFVKADRRGSSNPFFKGEGYYRGLYEGGGVVWGKVSYYLPYDDFSEDKLAQKLEEFTSEVLNREASIYPDRKFDRLWDIYDGAAVEAELEAKKSRTKM